MQARLKVLHDKANVKQVRLLPVTLIGRSTDCNLKIASSQVSRNHCRITLGEDAVFVEDLGSANGTLIDGHALPAHQPTSVSPGSHLVVGPAEFLVDFTGPTSPTMVLPGTQSGLSPEIPSTEVISPPAVPSEPVASEEAPVSPAPDSPAPFVAAPVVEAAVVAQPQPNIEPDVVAVTEVEAPQPDSAFLPADAEPPSVESQFAPAAFGFDESANSVEPGTYEEAAAFNFQETQPSAAAEFVADAAEVQAADSKKPGLKSLFSLFGRKGKASQDAESSAAATTPAAPPSVFLPTMDQQTETVAVETPVETVTPAYETQEFVPEPPEEDVSVANAVTDEGDGFQQFLQQL